MIENGGLRVEPELGSYEGVVEIVVVRTVPGIGAVADEEALAVAQVLVHAPGSVPVFRLFGHTGVLVVAESGDIALALFGGGIEAHEVGVDFVKAVGGNNVPRKRRLGEAAGGIGTNARRRVVDGVAGA